MGKNTFEQYSSVFYCKHVTQKWHITIDIFLMQIIGRQ